MVEGSPRSGEEGPQPDGPDFEGLRGDRVSPEAAGLFRALPLPEAAEPAEPPEAGGEAEPSTPEREPTDLEAFPSPPERGASQAEWQAFWDKLDEQRNEPETLEYLAAVIGRPETPQNLAQALQAQAAPHRSRAIIPPELQNQLEGYRPLTEADEIDPSAEPDLARLLVSSGYSHFVHNVESVKESLRNEVEAQRIDAINTRLRATIENPDADYNRQAVAEELIRAIGEDPDSDTHRLKDIFENSLARGEETIRRGNGGFLNRAEAQTHFREATHAFESPTTTAETWVWEEFETIHKQRKESAVLKYTSLTKKQVSRTLRDIQRGITPDASNNLPTNATEYGILATQAREYGIDVQGVVGADIHAEQSNIEPSEDLEDMALRGVFNSAVGRARFRYLLDQHTIDPEDSDFSRLLTSDANTRAFRSQHPAADIPSLRRALNERVRLEDGFDTIQALKVKLLRGVPIDDLAIDSDTLPPGVTADVLRGELTNYLTTIDTNPDTKTVLEHEPTPLDSTENLLYERARRIAEQILKPGRRAADTAEAELARVSRDLMTSSDDMTDEWFIENGEEYSTEMRKKYMESSYNAHIIAFQLAMNRAQEDLGDLSTEQKIAMGLLGEEKMGGARKASYTALAMAATTGLTIAANAIGLGAPMGAVTGAVTGRLKSRVAMGRVNMRQNRGAPDLDQQQREAFRRNPAQRQDIYARLGLDMPPVDELGRNPQAAAIDSIAAMIAGESAYATGEIRNRRNKAQTLKRVLGGAAIGAGVGLILGVAGEYVQSQVESAIADNTPNYVNPGEPSIPLEGTAGPDGTGGTYDLGDRPGLQVPEGYELTSVTDSDLQPYAEITNVNTGETYQLNLNEMLESEYDNFIDANDVKEYMSNHEGWNPDFYDSGEGGGTEVESGEEAAGAEAETAATAEASASNFVNGGNPEALTGLGMGSEQAQTVSDIATRLPESLTSLPTDNPYISYDPANANITVDEALGQIRENYPDYFMANGGVNPNVSNFSYTYTPDIQGILGQAGITIQF